MKYRDNYIWADKRMNGRTGRPKNNSFADTDG